MPTLPSGLAPIVSSYSIDEPGGVMRTEVAGGAARYALDWDRGPQQFHVTFAMNELLFSVWTAFYHHIIKKGSISFEMPLDSGFGLNMHTATIIPGSYSVTRANVNTSIVSFVVEAENQVYNMTDTDAQALIDLYAEYGETTNAVLSRIAQFSTVDSLVLDYA